MIYMGKEIQKRGDIRKQPSIVAFLPEKFHGQRNLVAYSLWGCKKVGHD